MSWAKQTGKEIGGVVAAAGVSTPAKIIDRHGDPFDLKGFDFVMSINVRGSIDLIRQLLPHMTKVEPEAPDGEVRTFRSQFSSVQYSNLGRKT